jgi:DNA-damage-inducible protein D
MDNVVESQIKLVIFQDKNIRRVLFEEDWFYSVVDICGALTISTNPRDYWYRVKKRLDDEEKSERSTICRPLKMNAPDGKMRKTDCANSEENLELFNLSPHQKQSLLNTG